VGMRRIRLGGVSMGKVPAGNGAISPPQKF
jgi:hypothetical protein